MMDELMDMNEEPPEDSDLDDVLSKENLDEYGIPFVIQVAIRLLMGQRDRAELESKRLRARFAELSYPMTEYGIREEPGQEPTEYCGYSEERIVAIAAECGSPVFERTAYRSKWQPREGGPADA